METASSFGRGVGRVKMPGDTYPRFRAAAVQAAPVFLDREATIDKLEGLVRRAVAEGAELVVFGESFIPAFPVWNLIYAPMDQHQFYRRLFDNALEVPGAQTRKLGEIAKNHGIILSVGVTEKAPQTMGTLWNTNLLFDRDGTLLNRHRKLVPTWAEKLSWANGDAKDLRPVQTHVGRIGTLLCGENTNTLARFALLAQGEQIHIATYPPAWPFYRPAGPRSYNLGDAIRLRSAAHAFEGKVFNVVASCALDAASIEELSRGDSSMKELLQTTPAPVSLIVGPDGGLLAELLQGGEGIVVAEIDIARSIEPKMFHDIVGHYNRFDVFRLEVDPTPNRPLWIRTRTAQTEGEGEESWATTTDAAEHDGAGTLGRRAKPSADS
jgi:predicted amidohydrolase